MVNYAMKIIMKICTFGLLMIIVLASMSNLSGVVRAGNYYEIWYGKKPFPDEALRYDSFIVILRQNPDLIGYVAFSVGKKDSYKKVKARINRGIKHIVEYRKFDKKRLIVIYMGTSDETTTILHFGQKTSPVLKLGSSDKIVTSKFRSLND